MSFFEPPAPPEPPEPRRQPRWLGPPENELGVTIPLRLELARTDELVLAIADVVAYSSGFTFRVAVRIRPTVRFDPHSFMSALHRPDERSLRLGIAFADGRKSTSGRRGRHPHPTEPPDLVLLSTGGGGGGGGAYELRQWVYPVPPPGPVTFVAVWPERGIAETKVEIDAQPIIEAAAQSEALWPDEPGEAGSVITSSSVVREAILRHLDEAPPPPDR